MIPVKPPRKETRIQEATNPRTLTPELQEEIRPILLPEVEKPQTEPKVEPKVISIHIP